MVDRQSLMILHPPVNLTLALTKKDPVLMMMVFVFQYCCRAAFPLLFTATYNQALLL